ncbi:MAG: ABC transporter ATP-binding protein [Thermoleophilia bacterium]
MSATVVRPEKLEVEGVVKRFAAGRRRPPVTALDGIDLTVSAGELVCIVGASGCGKSTLLNAIGGLEPVTEGRIEIDGERVVGPGADRGMVFQAYSLYPWKTVAQNVAFGLETARVPRAERRERVAELLAIMGLTAWADRIPRELSGGMRQRVAIARALAPRPDILLLDEPFGALDAQTKRAMQDFLLELWRELGTTILMVTHDVSEAVYLAGRVYVLTSHPGRVAAEVPVPLGPDRGPGTTREPRFLDLRDGIQEILVSQVRL